MFGGLAKSLFGSSNDRYVRSLNPILAKIAGFEPSLKAMSDAELSAQTVKFRERLANGEKLDSILPEAFATVREAEELYERLKERWPDAMYHGKMNAADRKDAQDRFMADEFKAMIATNAFGLGIDKQDIRFVAHYHFPGSVEAYYQEAGRAGRDGLPATSWGIRAAGDPTAMVSRVAVCGGAGDSLLAEVAAAGVQAYVTADLRHHPADEHRRVSDVALVDVAHWASEFPWCNQAAALLREHFGPSLPVTVSDVRTDPWNVEGC